MNEMRSKLCLRIIAHLRKLLLLFPKTQQQFPRRFVLAPYPAELAVWVLITMPVFFDSNVQSVTFAQFVTLKGSTPFADDALCVMRFVRVLKEKPAASWINHPMYVTAVLLAYPVHSKKICTLLQMLTNNIVMCFPNPEPAFLFQSRKYAVWTS